MSKKTEKAPTKNNLKKFKQYKINNYHKILFNLNIKIKFLTKNQKQINHKIFNFNHQKYPDIIFLIDLVTKDLPLHIINLFKDNIKI